METGFCGHGKIHYVLDTHRPTGSNPGIQGKKTLFPRWGNANNPLQLKTSRMQGSWWGHGWKSYQSEDFLIYYSSIHDVIVTFWGSHTWLKYSGPKHMCSPREDVKRRFALNSHKTHNPVRRTSFILMGLTGKPNAPVSSEYFFSKLARFFFSWENMRNSVMIQKHQ